MSSQMGRANVPPPSAGREKSDIIVRVSLTVGHTCPML
jgi:hypothetical protein